MQHDLDKHKIIHQKDTKGCIRTRKHMAMARTHKKKKNAS